MALTADRHVSQYTTQELIDLPVDDDVLIYKGALVGRNRATGYARPLVAGDDFLGLAYARADNTIIGHTAGGVRVRLHQHVDIVHTLSGVALGDIGRPVFASADDTLSLTPGSGSRIGCVVAVETTGLARIRCQPAPSFPPRTENLPLAFLSDASATLSLDQINRVAVISNTTARTLTLPAAATVRGGGWLRVVKLSAAAAAVTLDANAAETINGSTTLATIDAKYDSVLLMCTGSEWVVLSRDLA